MGRIDRRTHLNSAFAGPVTDEDIAVTKERLIRLMEEFPQLYVLLDMLNTAYPNVDPLKTQSAK